jgi:hypothetical protein
MAPAPRTPEIICPRGHPIRPDGSHISLADLELHIWELEASHYPGAAGPCVNAQMCIWAGAPWHRADSKMHREPSRA